MKKLLLLSLLSFAHITHPITQSEGIFCGWGAIGCAVAAYAYKKNQEFSIQISALKKQLRNNTITTETRKKLIQEIKALNGRAYKYELATWASGFAGSVFLAKAFMSREIRLKPHRDAEAQRHDEDRRRHAQDQEPENIIYAFHAIKRQHNNDANAAYISLFNRWIMREIVNQHQYDNDVQALDGAWHEILAVHVFATDTQVIQAHRTLNLIHHPDKNPNDRAGATARVQRINGAMDFYRRYLQAVNRLRVPQN